MLRVPKPVLVPVIMVAVVGLLVFVVNVQKSSATYTCLNGGDHAGANWDPATDCPSGLFAGVHTNIGTFSIGTGETATVQAYNGTSYGTANVTATTVSIVGTLSASGQGYSGGTSSGNGSGPGGGGGSASSAAGGGAYGAWGGTGNGGMAGGSAYGSGVTPGANMGSGGGANGAAAGGNGGGSITITASGTATISGTIAANGISAGSGNAGGGAGGGISIAAATVTGAGTVTANGGNGCCAGWGGGGSGGRIEVSYSSSNTYTGSMTASSGGSGSVTAGNGTVLLLNSGTNDLYINTSQTWYANPAMDGSSVSYHSITIQNSSTLGAAGYYTTNSNGVGITFNVTDFTIATGSALTATGGGYAGGGSGANGAGPGAGIGSTSVAPGGGAYGGYGATGNAGASGGSPYSSAMNPVGLGSGGGGGNGTTGGAGGGAIAIKATGTVTVSGSITSNGNGGSGSHAGGGSGGSVLIVTPTFAGAGSISANGGSGCCSGWGGGGSGGRVKVSYSSSNTFTGTMSATNGASGCCSQNGTVVLYDSTNNDVYINATQTWFADPALDGSSFTFRNVTVQNNSTLGLNGYYTTNTNGVGVSINAANVTVSTGSAISANGTGYAGGSNNGNGAGPGGGTGSASLSGGGGGYGGNGATGNAGAAGGLAYGNKLQPIDLGSGGGANGSGGFGGAGGGAIIIKATGTVTVSGTICANGTGANGGSSGGGSGGGIMVTAGTITGAGSITANGGAGNNNGWGGGGGGGRIMLNYGSVYSFTGTTQVNAASGGSGQQNGTFITFHHALIDRAITMSSSVPSGTSVSYEVVFKPTTSTSIGGVVVDICDDTPAFGAATCTYPAGFDWGGASPSLTVNGGMGTGWTASGVQGGAGTGKSQALKLSNATPQSVSTGTNIDFTITTVTNPSTANHTFYARVLTFNTSGNMTAEYTISGTTRSGNLTDSLDDGGFALSTGQGISLSFVVPESLVFCVSGSSIGSNCSSTTSPAIMIGHGVGPHLDSTAVDHASVYTQTSTNAGQGVVVSIAKAGKTMFDPVGDRYRMPITVNNSSNASTLGDYQVKVTVDTATLISASKMRSDCGDARFVDANQVTVLNYWLASGCNTSSTVFWVKVPSIPGSSSKTIYLYYGNANLTSTSSGANTFIYYDDFSTNTTGNYVGQGSPTIVYDATNKLMQQTNTAQSQHWIIASNDVLPTSYVYEADVRIDSDPANLHHAGLAFDFLTTAVTGYRVDHLNATFEGYEWTNNVYTSLGSTFADSGIYSLGSWLTERVYRDRSSGSIKYEITNGTTTVSGTYSNTVHTTGHIGFHSYGDSVSYDNIHVRNYSSPEPTTTTGSEASTGCGGLSEDSGATCGIPAVNTSCTGSCSAVTITAGTAAFGMCVLAGTANITVLAPYNGASCGTGTSYGFDDATATSVRSPYGSPIFSSSGMLSQENDTLTFAATASGNTPEGTYAGNYLLIATGTF